MDYINLPLKVLSAYRMLPRTASALEGKKTSLPVQMDLALKREKETKSNGKTKS